MAKRKETKRAAQPSPQSNNNRPSNNSNSNSGGSKPKPVQKAVAKALKKDNKIGSNEARALIADFGYRGVQAMGKALATKNRYEISKSGSQVSGINEKKGGVYFTPGRSTLLPLIGSDYGWIKGDIPQQSNTRAPGKGWVASNMASPTNPTYRFVGKGYKDLRIGGRGNGNRNGNGGGRVDRSTGNYRDILDALGEDRDAARDWQQDLINDIGFGSSDFGIGSSQDIANGAQGAQSTLNPYPNLGGQIASAAQQQQQQLNDLMMRQQAAYQEQQRLQQQQIAAANAAYLEQQRQANALSRAYVPGLNDVAYSPLVGDMRSTANSSTLSGLAILNTGSALSGLQIA